MRLIILMLVLASVALTGCLGEEQQVNETVEEPPPKPVVKPSFTITSPASGELVMIPAEGGDVTLTLSIRNLILKSPGGAAKNGEGHFRITVDGGERITVASKIYVIGDLSEGEHTVEVELVNNDGSSYSPPIRSDVTFNVEKEAPPEYIPQTHTVAIHDFDFDPQEITVKVSDSITFVNEGSFPRSATCFLEGEEVFDTKILATGESATINMDRVLECEYYSITHRAMVGRVIVESNE